MRNDIGKKLCHFFMVDQSSLLSLILHEIACLFFLLSKFELLINYIMKKRHRVSQNNCKRPLLLANFLIFRFSYPLEFKDEKIGQKY